MGATARCLGCGKPAPPRRENPHFPFCSERCRLLDLGKWLGEEYRIPAGLPGDGAVTTPASGLDDDPA
jgi:endogenous inhibitor of DNA gyrase (YacG/DUF329 family)